MRRRSGKLSRRPPTLERRRRFLIVCEGEKTEPLYFKNLIQSEQVTLAEVHIVRAAGVPRTVVKRAVQRKKEAERYARSLRDEYFKYDEVWCVIDVDEHPGLDEALQQAEANGIKVALSNPCFELWVLLHFEDHRAFSDRTKVQSLVREHLRGYSKTVPYEALRDRYATAVERAGALARWQEEQGRRLANPSTSVHQLTQALLRFSKSKALARLVASRK